MRRSGGAVLVAAALMAAACGDDDAGGALDSGESGFCDDFQQVFGDVSAGTDGELSREEGIAAIEAMDDLDPPDVIASDFEVLVEFLEFAAENPDGPSPDEETLDEWRAAIGRLNTFVEDECGITAPTD
ncbi:MAG: hypothetical protein ACRD2C_11545 [Acidimicrobiales bacterium]